LDKKIQLIIVMIFVLAIISAGVLSRVSNVLSGTVTISEAGEEEMVFYADSGKLLVIGEDPDYGSYLELIGEEIDGWTTNGLETIELDYIPQVDFYLKGKIYVGELPEELTLIFGYDDSESNFNEICSVNQLIDLSESYEDYGPINCQGIEIPSDISKIYYKLKGNCESCTYKIGGLGTRMEVSPI